MTTSSVIFFANSTLDIAFHMQCKIIFMHLKQLYKSWDILFAWIRIISFYIIDFSMHLESSFFFFLPSWPLKLSRPYIGFWTWCYYLSDLQNWIFEKRGRIFFFFFRVIIKKRKIYFVKLIIEFLFNFSSKRKCFVYSF